MRVRCVIAPPCLDSAVRCVVGLPRLEVPPVPSLVLLRLIKLPPVRYICWAHVLRPVDTTDPFVLFLVLFLLRSLLLLPPFLTRVQQPMPLGSLLFFGSQFCKHLIEKGERQQGGIPIQISRSSRWASDETSRSIHAPLARGAIFFLSLTQQCHPRRCTVCYCSPVA